ncbi:sialate O-acetylesterase [Abyssalbus ytuae]|uniref:Sialate O-acetylesterase n=1 Tax=Abyssalbus ytuae TaxID=2926907 RepID=A0A9E6ZM00_9FLAO|nr:sialate O-acetylesterase [Abyssalbus ytuae]UOB18254.1 sialate O-acetylesterase [Abyssalbus ytuae]
MKIINHITLWVFLFISHISFSNVSLPSIFGDHMVLQQNAEVKIWGWGNPTEEITITTGWNSKTIKTVTNNEATWQVKIITPKAGGPFEITIEGYNKIIIKDVLIGEVWLCSGQSNMEWTPSAGIDNAEEEIAKAYYPSIRFFSTPKKASQYPQLDLEGEWKVCTPETMQYFSAIGYFFGQKINSTLNIPVGLISSNWGGSPAEVWIPENVIRNDQILNEASIKLKEEPWSPNKPGMAYNTMIYPLINFKLAGVLWYQGETNTQNAATYAELLSTLIHTWRKNWNDFFPFYYAQIAPYRYGEDNFNGVIVRDQQRKVLNSTDNTGMIIVSDIGNINDIHPRNKKDVGLRFASLALNRTYGIKNIAYSGPVFKKFEIENNKMRLKFDFSEGLKFTKKLNGFEIAGTNGKFYPANAKIDKDNTVVVWNNKVKTPVTVRYEWNNVAEPGLINNTGIPASSFTTGDY